MGLIFRLILWAFLVYFLYQFVRNIFVGLTSPIDRQRKAGAKVHGNGQSNPPLDLSDRDVEDAIYKDINEEKSN